MFTNYIDSYGKKIVYENDGYSIAVSDDVNPTRVSLWYEKKNVGNLYLQMTNFKSKKYMKVSSLEILPKFRGQGLSTIFYKVALKYLDKDVKGIISYLPDRINKKQVPKIYSKLNAFIVDSDYQIIPKKANEALIHDNSLKQLKRVATMSKNTDIGIKTSSYLNKFSNIIGIKNIANNNNIETYEDFVKANKKSKK